MSMNKLEQAVSELQYEERVTLYANKEGIRRAYYRIGEGDQLALSDQLTKRGEVGILGFFKGQLQNTAGYQSLIQISDAPELMAIMVETHFRISGELLEMPDEPFRRDARLIKYVGESYLTEDDQEVTAETTGLSDDSAQIVEKERHDQQNRMKKWTDDPRMLVWTAAGDPNLASIALRIWAQPYGGYWASGYSLMNPKGILGSIESEKNGIVFITPLWIWHVAHLA